MELPEADRIIEDLKGRFDAPFNSSDKTTIERLYRAVLGKTFVPTSCQQCYHDGLVEVYNHLKKYRKMAKTSNYRLKAGAIINCPNFMNGKVFSNDNITDGVARKYLKQFPNNVDMFQVVPEEEKEKQPEEGKGKQPEDGED